MIPGGARNAIAIRGGSRPRNSRIVYAGLCRECGGYNIREGKKPAPASGAFLAPGTSADRWYGLESRTEDRHEQLPIPRPAVRPARGRVAVNAGGDRGEDCHGGTGRKSAARTEGRGA